MKKILCYGDSNTFGYNPSDTSRYDEKTGWTALLQADLGSGYEIIEEGVCDRTGFVHNPKGFLLSAREHFPQMLSKKDNVDLIILAVGTNDLQFQYNITFSDIENGLKNLIQAAQKKVKQIILIPPVVLNEKVLEGYFSFQFDNMGIEKSKQAGEIYNKLAKLYNCRIFDINKFVKPSDIDGLHYDSISHKIIADKLSDYIKLLSL